MRENLVQLALNWLSDPTLNYPDNPEYIPAISSGLKLTDKEITELRYRLYQKITGNQPAWALKNMIKALNSHSWLNTQEEKKRLEAAKFLLKHTKRSIRK